MRTADVLDRLESCEGHDLCRLRRRLRLVVSLQSRQKKADRPSARQMRQARAYGAWTDQSELSVERSLSEPDRERRLRAGGVDLVTQHKVRPVPVRGLPRLEAHQIAQVLERRDYARVARKASLVNLVRGRCSRARTVNKDLQGDPPDPAPVVLNFPAMWYRFEASITVWRKHYKKIEGLSVRRRASAPGGVRSSQD